MRDALAPDLAAWPITPTGATRAELGWNNDSFFVSAREGEYVLRVYRNTAEHEHVRYEHEVLGRLAAVELPFAVPSPVRSRDGDTLAVLETSDGPRLAALFERIPGEPASVTRTNARLAGAALARLDDAFTRLDLPLRPPATLADVHRLVPDPRAAIGELGLDAPTRDAVLAVFERVEREHDPLVAALPRQIVHGDFAFPNLLVDGRRVTGLLDFEFARGDLRAADLAGALYITVVRGDARDRWRLLDALASGYRRALPLDPTEIAALPSLMLRRCALGVVHWMGRWRQGLVDLETARERPRRLVPFAAWLDPSAPQLVLLAGGEVRSARW